MRHFLHRLGKRPFADLVDHADFLGQRNEVAGGDWRSVRKFEPHQGFEANHAMAGGSHQRLKLKREFVFSVASRIRALSRFRR